MSGGSGDADNRIHPANPWRAGLARALADGESAAARPSRRWPTEPGRGFAPPRIRFSPYGQLQRKHDGCMRAAPPNPRKP